MQGLVPNCICDSKVVLLNSISFVSFILKKGTENVLLSINMNMSYITLKAVVYCNKDCLTERGYKSISSEF